MKNNVGEKTKHEQTILIAPDGIDISVDSNIAELISLLWVNGIDTNFSCEGTASSFSWANEYLEHHEPTFNEYNQMRAYISMPHTDRSMDFILSLLDSFMGLGKSYESSWSFEFTMHHEQGPRICLRFPHNDIPKIVSFLRD